MASHPAFTAHGFWICNVTHHRISPKPHRFKNNLFWFGLDLTRLSYLPNWFGLFSCTYPALVQFCDADFFPSSDQGKASSRIIQYLNKQGVLVPSNSHVIMLGQLRTMGYLFNPITVYFLFSPDEEPLYAIAEVTNTFYERKAFLIPRTSWDCHNKEVRFASSVPKNFYVSPFSDLTLDFSFLIQLTSNNISLEVKSVDESLSPLIYTELTGRFVPFSFFALIRQLISFPLVPLQIIIAIHWQALKLWLKRVPYHKKESSRHLQTDLLISK